MFQLKRWNTGTVHRDRHSLTITVSRPGGFGRAIELATWAIILLPMASLFSIVFLVPILRAGSPSDLPWRALPAIAFGVPGFLMFRWIFELQFADQVVTVSAGRIAWVRKTKWWARKRGMKTDAVTDVSASTGWGGLGRVEITARGRRHTILFELLNADAVQFAHDVKNALKS